LQATPAQAMAAEVVCRVWKEQSGSVALYFRQLISRLELEQRRERPSRVGVPRHTIGDLLLSEMQTLELTAEDRNDLTDLIAQLNSMRLLPERVKINQATILATDDRGLFEECLSRTSIADVFARAAMGAAARTWVGASELRNLLRAWLQRRPAGEKVIAITPFTPEVSSPVGPTRRREELGK
jgi:hypothetical protein